MKSEHRHELKTNELAEWLVNLPQWLKENSKTIIGITVLVVVLVSFYGWRRYDKNVVQIREQIEFTKLLDGISIIESNIVAAQEQGIDNSHELLTHADNLKSFAVSVREKNMAAIALIKQADILRLELHYRLGTISKRDMEGQINRAKASYTEAMQKASSNLSLRAAAKFGLGLCAEELGNFEEARKRYQDIVASADFEGTITIVQAKRRLNNMSEYQKEIVFKPAPKKEPAVATKSTLQIKPIDVNLPAGINVPVDVNQPIDTNIPVDVNLIPQKPDYTPQVPDINLAPLLPDEVSKDSDVNVPVE